MNLKLITIDFWNTIFDSSNGTARNNYRIDEMKSEIAKLGVSISMDEYSIIMEKSWEHFNSIWKNELRTPSLQESQNFFWSHLNLPPNQEVSDRLSKVFADSILYYPPKLVAGVESALSELSKRFKLAIISDTGFSPGIVLRRLMHENDILHYFSAFSFSDETQVAKPHPKAYQTILSKLNVRAEDALHIGDIEETDIKGAKNMGMKAIRFSGDPTAFLNLNNSKSTAADFDSDSWVDIVEYINGLE